ncbi:MAG: hypothetical protein Q8P50_02270 [Bacillota bacterium]|nr:hypothetical protein [Bacillota bacterium]
MRNDAIWDLTQDRALAFLVALSLLLTLRIWLGIPVWDAGFEPFNPRTDPPADLGLGNILAPGVILVHQGRDAHYGLPNGSEDFNAVWQGGKALVQILAATSGVRKQAPQAAEIAQARTEGPSLEFVFDEAYQLSSLARALGAEAQEADVTVDRLIMLASKTPTVYVRTSPKLEYIAYTVKPESTEVFGLAKKGLSASVPRYSELPKSIGELQVTPGTYALRDTPQVALLNVQADPTPAAGVLSTFFVDLQILRTIVERDGATIYSDGKRGARVYPAGAVEYSQPQPGDPEADKVVAIERAARFAVQHGGLPATACVDKVITGSKAGESTRVQFGFRFSGTPIIGARGIISVSLNNKGVEAFLRSFRLPIGQGGQYRSVLSPRDTLATIAGQSAKLFGDVSPGQVISMELVYLVGAPADPVEPLKPVWKVEFSSGASLVADAYTGQATRRSGQ